MTLHENKLRNLLNNYGYRKTLKFLAYAYEFRKGIKIPEDEESLGLAIYTMLLLDRTTGEKLEYELSKIVDLLNELLLDYSNLYKQLDAFSFDIDDYSDENGDLPDNMDEDTFVTQLVLKSL